MEQNDYLTLSEDGKSVIECDKDYEGVVVIPEGVTDIDENAFACCSLTEIKLPDSLKEIGFGAFNNCENLTSVAIPSSVTFIGGFSNCPRLTSINVPGGVETIWETTFSDCKSLTSVVITSGVKKINRFAFSGCSSLTSIMIPDSVEWIGEGVFENCTDLASVELSDNLSFICSSTFCNCKSLSHIVLPSQLRGIGDKAFSSCESLTTVEIPFGVTEIREGAFMGCTSLISIEIPDGVTEIEDYTFEGCTSLTSVVIPSSVKKIGKHAFEGCTSLTSLVIPDSVEKIGKDAFLNCPAYTAKEVPTKVNKAKKSTTDNVSKEYKLKFKVNGDIDEYVDCVVKLTGKEVQQLVDFIIENDGETDVEEIELEEELPEIYEKLDEACSDVAHKVFYNHWVVEGYWLDAFEPKKNLKTVCKILGFKTRGKDEFELKFQIDDYIRELREADAAEFIEDIYDTDTNDDYSVGVDYTVEIPNAIIMKAKKAMKS